jgi:L-ascorbate metabolism protein UlaG (beta-lactamase superfamily)
MNRTREIQLPGANEAPDVQRGSLQFIGTATVLLRYAGFTLLTDPNFLHKGEQIDLGYGLHTTRLTDPAINIEDLPPLDLVVLSHMHEDHFDRIAEQRLDKRLPIITTLQAAAALRRKGFKSTHGLNTWESLTVLKGGMELRITAMPAKHAPGILSILLPPVMGSMLEFRAPTGETTLRLYITGDTLLYKRLREIRARYPEIDLALLHLGGTRIYGVLVTMDAQQGLEALEIITPRTAIPIHFNDYPVFTSPLEDFMRAVTAAGLDHRVKYLRSGETYTFTNTQREEV